MHTATSSANSQTQQSRKGKGKGKGGTPKRPKVATVTLKVVPVDPSTRCTPMASYRNKHLRLVHLEKCCNDVKALDAIRSELQVPSSKIIRYMYTRGRSLRPATLEDVPGATSWNGDTLFSLAGAGHLYIQAVEIDGGESKLSATNTSVGETQGGDTSKLSTAGEGSKLSTLGAVTPKPTSQAPIIVSENTVFLFNLYLYLHSSHIIIVKYLNVGELMVTLATKLDCYHI